MQYRNGACLFLFQIKKILPQCRTFCFFVVALQGPRSQSTQLRSSSLLSALGFASPSRRFNCIVASHWRPRQLSCEELHAASQASPEKLTAPVLPRCLKHRDEMIDCSMCGNRSRFSSAGWKHTETLSEILLLTASLLSPLWIHTPRSLPILQRPLPSVHAPLVSAPFQTFERHNNVHWFFFFLQVAVKWRAWHAIFSSFLSFRIDCAAPWESGMKNNDLKMGSF